MRHNSLSIDGSTASKSSRTLEYVGFINGPFSESLEQEGESVVLQHLSHEKMLVNKRFCCI